MLRAIVSRFPVIRTLRIPALHPAVSVPFSTSSPRDPDTPSTVSLFGRDPSQPPNLFVVQPRFRPDSLLNSKLSEALNLAKSLEDPRDGFFLHDFQARKSPSHLVVQNPASRGLKADTYFGPGTVDNIKCQIRALEEKGDVDAVFVNSILTGIQQRNLEAAWGKPVLDRVGLIIEIFNAHAETKEAKLQSELAALMYKKSRLVRVRGPGGRLAFGVGGEAEVVSARGRASGGRGFISGAGETELQLQHRRIKERRLYLLSQIEEVRRTRSLQRSARKRHGGSCGEGLATVAFVGYTNAGKSTLVGALSDSDLYSDDRLFATVDPRLRSVFLPSGKKVLLSDTVGFISDLPVQLVEAFHATLEEHVLDSSAPNVEEQRESVLKVLEQIGVSEEKIQNMIEVWNKIDLIERGSGANEVPDDEFLIDSEEDNKDFQGDYEDGKLSEIENRLTTENSSSDEHANDCDMASELYGEEDPKSFVEEFSDLSDSETHHADDSVGEFSPLEDLEADKLDTTSLNGKKSLATYEVNDAKYVKTSAVMGVGLQELLHHIDGKLSIKKCEKSLGPFDRKWRPSSFTEETEKVAHANH